MFPFLILILLFLFLIVLGFKYDSIMGPVERCFSKIDSAVFCGRESGNVPAKSYSIGVSVKIALLLAVIFLIHSIISGNHGLQGSVYSNSILLLYIFYKIIFGYFKIDISDSGVILFHSVVASKHIKTSDIIEIKENILSYTITYSDGKVSYSNYPDSYRSFTAEIKCERQTKNVTS